MTVRASNWRRQVLFSTGIAITALIAGIADARETAVTGTVPVVAGAPVSHATTTGSAEPGQQAASLWSGEVEAGFINTAGNSRSENMRARLKLQYEPGTWKHGLTGDFIQVSDQDKITTEQFNAALKSDRALSVRSYLFVNGRYDTDRIAGYSPRVTESAGYGRRFPFTDRMVLEAETGAGGRHTWNTDGSKMSEAIVRLAVRYIWKFGSMSEFSESAFLEFGDSNVHSESQTSLTTRINSDFSLRMNVTVKHDTVVPVDRHKTDMITSMTLVYDL
jgi:putative salt-induced outer membrane protein